MSIPIFAACDNQREGVLKTHYLEQEHPQEYFEEELIKIVRPESLDKNLEYYFVLSMDSKEIQQNIIEQLRNLDIRCTIFIGDAYQRISNSSQKEKFLSYAENSEDLILHHALRKINAVFYLDVGANDPWNFSMTQSFYCNNGRGVNIEANRLFYDQLIKYRERDINVNIAVGDAPGEVDFPLDYGPMGTLNLEFTAMMDKYKKIERKHGYQKVRIDTLANIVKKYVPKGQDIHFCKIDTEGYEEKCLCGMDWGYNRPWIFCVESTLQFEEVTKRTDLQWEHILKENGYFPALLELNNKYYVANEHRALAEELLPRWYLFQLYDCYVVRESYPDGMTPEDGYYWDVERAGSGEIRIQKA